MINFKVKIENCDAVEDVKGIFHQALKGSPAYIKSEIAICDASEDKDGFQGFYLVVGNQNGEDIDISLIVPDNITG